MKLWVLKPICDKSSGLLPECFRCYSDIYFGFVVCAETEKRAREIVGSYAAPFLDEKVTSCVELLPIKEEIILSDYR